MEKKHIIRNILICLPIIAIAIGCLYSFISDYIESLPKLQYTFNENTSENIVSYPNAEFAVISDLHYYDNSLGTTGTAFENVLKSDRKLLNDSSDLLNFAIENILKSNVKFVLVPGDLTKDGELICHTKTAEAFSKLTQNGIKVYVVPGNHDVNNPLAYKYNGDQSIPISNITPNEFADIYKDCGYNSALYRDPNTLSYVVEPIANLWVIGLDTCRYKENQPGEEEIFSGKISQDEEIWLSDMLKKAKENNKSVILLQHHGIVEHWKGQSKLHPEYLVQDYKYLGKLVASYDVRLAFTGHYHAQDIALGNFDNDKFLYDVETGSLITAPCPVRYCDIIDNKITIKSDFLAIKLHPDTDFEKNANEFVFATIRDEAYKKLRDYLVPEDDADRIADYLGSSFMAHYRGDEDLQNLPEFDKSELGFWSKIVLSKQQYIIDGLWNDVPPGDNNVTLDLNGQ